MKNTAITTIDTASGADPCDQEERLAHLAQEIWDGIEEFIGIYQAAWEKGKPYAVKVGNLLIEAKALVKEQGLNWIPWVEEHCCDERVAQRYMRIAAHKDDLRLIAAEEEAKANGRALSIEEADKALRKTKDKDDAAPKPNSQPVGNPVCVEERADNNGIIDIDSNPKHDASSVASSLLSDPIIEARQQDGEGVEDNYDAQTEDRADRDKEADTELNNGSKVSPRADEPQEDNHPTPIMDDPAAPAPGDSPSILAAKAVARASNALLAIKKEISAKANPTDEDRKRIEAARQRVIQAIKARDEADEAAREEQKEQQEQRRLREQKIAVDDVLKTMTAPLLAEYEKELRTPVKCVKGIAEEIDKRLC